MKKKAKLKEKNQKSKKRLKTTENQGQARKALEFLTVTAAVAIIVYAVLSLPPFENALGWLAAETSRVFLAAEGVNARVAWTAGSPHLIGVNASGVAFDAELVELCWGKLEVALLAGFIAASRDRSRRERVKGITVGTGFMLVAFNPLRISVSLLAINPFVHDVLFRIFLIATLAFYYALWYAWLSLPSIRKAK